MDAWSIIHFFLYFQSAAIGWRPIQDGPRLSPPDSWERLQQTPATQNWISRYRKWMDVSCRAAKLKLTLLSSSL